MDSSKVNASLNIYCLRVNRDVNANFLLRVDANFFVDQTIPISGRRVYILLLI